MILHPPPSESQKKSRNHNSIAAQIAVATMLTLNSPSAGANSPQINGTPGIGDLRTLQTQDPTKTPEGLLAIAGTMALLQRQLAMIILSMLLVRSKNSQQPTNEMDQKIRTLLSELGISSQEITSETKSQGDISHSFKYNNKSYQIRIYATPDENGNNLGLTIDGIGLNEQDEFEKDQNPHLILTSYKYVERALRNLIINPNTDHQDTRSGVVNNSSIELDGAPSGDQRTHNNSGLISWIPGIFKNLFYEYFPRNGAQRALISSMRRLLEYYADDNELIKIYDRNLGDEKAYKLVLNDTNFSCRILIWNDGTLSFISNNKILQSDGTWIENNHRDYPKVSKKQIEDFFAHSATIENSI